MIQFNNLDSGLDTSEASKRTTYRGLFKSWVSAKLTDKLRIIINGYDTLGLSKFREGLKAAFGQRTGTGMLGKPKINYNRDLSSAT